MGFSEELTPVLPSIDPWPGIEHGDELRLVTPEEARPYVEHLVLRFERLGLEVRLRDKAHQAADAGRRPTEMLIRAWASGDTAIIVRLRRGLPVTIVFWERETPTRVRSKFQLGHIDKSWTGVQALYDVGIRELVADVVKPRHATRLRRMGFREAEKGELLLTMDERP